MLRQSHGRILAILCLGCFLTKGTAQGESLPSLDRTNLYTEKTQSCRDVALATWTHPTRAVLEKYSVVLDRIQLCNHDTYPIYTVRFKYDPQGQTDSYFHPLYAAMEKANGNWPFSFVDLQDKEIISIATSKPGAIAIAYEAFK